MISSFSPSNKQFIVSRFRKSRLDLESSPGSITWIRYWKESCSADQVQGAVFLIPTPCWPCDFGQVLVRDLKYSGQQAWSQVESILTLTFAVSHGSSFINQPNPHLGFQFWHKSCMYLSPSFSQGGTLFSSHFPFTEALVLWPACRPPRKFFGHNQLSGM